MIRNLEQLLNKLSSFGLLTKEEEKQIEDAFLYIDQNLKEKSEYIIFIQNFNKITGKKYIGDTESRKLYYKYEGYYTLNERIKAVENSLNDNWLKENNTILTPKYCLKKEFTAKYINFKKQIHNDIKTNDNPFK